MIKIQNIMSLWEKKFVDRLHVPYNKIVESVYTLYAKLNKKNKKTLNI